MRGILPRLTIPDSVMILLLLARAGVYNLALVSILFLTWVCLCVMFRNDLYEANQANFAKDPRRPVDVRGLVWD